jgi:hypothetical protein
MVEYSNVKTSLFEIFYFPVIVSSHKLQILNILVWGRFCNWITSTENRLYIGWFGVLPSSTFNKRAVFVS